MVAVVMTMSRHRGQQHPGDESQDETRRDPHLRFESISLFVWLWFMCGSSIWLA